MSSKIITVLLILVVSVSYSQQFSNYDPHILTLSPSPNVTNAADSSSITITFSESIGSTPSASDFQIIGSVNGNYNYDLNYNGGNNTITLIPTKRFASGEKINVGINNILITSGNDTIQPFSWNFIVRPAAGSGSFSVAYNKKLFETSGDHVTTDINSDGLTDLINYNYSYGRVVIYKNSPGMNFSETIIQVGSTPACISAADYNNDGLLDITAVHQSHSNSVTILKQNPDGSFDQTKLGDNISAMVVKNADIDNDGYVDLIFYSYTQSDAIYMYKNKGEFNFELAVKIPMPNSSRDFELSDLDNDGDVDLVFCSFHEGRIYIYENKDSFQFSAAGFIQIQGEPIKTICADFNDDGLPDISVLDGSVSFFRNMDSLKFTKASSSYFGSPSSFTHCDFDNDGDLDIAAVSMDTYLTLLKNNGSFNFTRTAINFKQSNLSRIVSADFDNDGDIDMAFNSLIIAGNRNKTPDIKLSSNSYNFKIVTPGTHRQTSFNIYNDGAEQTLELKDIKSSGSSFIAEPSSGSIKPGDSLKVLITFKPNGSADYSDSLMIFSNDISDSVKKFFISGTGSQVLSVYPSPNLFHPNDTTAIEVKFGLPLDVSTLNESNIKITGSYSGIHKISQINYDQSDSTLTVFPEYPFKKGESVTVSLTSGIKTNTDQLFRPYTWEFKIQPKMSSSIFREKKSLSVPDETVMVLPKDIENDGDQDLLILSRADKIVIYKNNGSWNFASPVILDGGFGPSTISAGDYDNDGDNDIVVTNLNSKLIFYKNNGNMTFTQITLSNVNGYIEYLTQGDYDGDGYIDFIAASSSSDNKFHVIKNNGNFNFVIDSTFNVYGSRFNSSDLDNDGDLDIFSYRIFTNEGNLNFNSDIYVGSNTGYKPFNPDNDNDIDLLFYPGGWRNDGELKFSTMSLFPYNSNISGAVVNDFDGDANEDVCFSCNGSFSSPESFMIYRNSGDMNFTLTAVEKIANRVRYSSSTDLDGDGDNDLMFINSSIITLYENRDHFSGIALSSGMHNFGPVPIDSSKSVSFYIYNNGTMPLEIDTLITSNNAFSVSPSKGIIQPHDSLQINVTMSPDEVKIYSDSISIHSNDNEQPVVLFYLKGRAAQKIIASTFPLQNDLHVISDTIIITFEENAAAGSLNRNTVKVSGSKTGSHSCSYYYEGHTKTLLVLPDGEFAAGELVFVIVTNQIELMSGVPVLASYNWSFTRGVKEGSAKFKKIPGIVTGGYPNYISNGDLNNDGLTDLIVSNEQANKISIIISERGKGPGDIKFLDPGSVPSDIICDDFNEDGKIDILVNCSNSFAVFQNTGANNFIRNSFNHFSGITCITTGDYDGDGSIDIAGFSPNHNSVQIFINKGGFVFDKINLPVDISSAGQILSADFDVDGDVDLILTTHTVPNFLILKNEEQLEFTPLLQPGVSEYVAAMTLADFDSDNMIDVAAQSPYSNSISILHNDGDFNFHTIQQPGIKFNPYEITSADFNADGDIDLAALNPNSNNGTVYLNDSTGFRLVYEFIRESGSYSMTTGDFNGDGSIDIAYVNPGANAVNCYLNSAFRNFVLSAYHYKFDEIKAGDTADVNITIYNPGLDSVRIDSLCFVNKLFSSETAPFILAPGDSGLINIIFKPDSAYNCIDTLILYSNTNSFNTIIIEGSSVPLSGIDGKNNLPDEYTLFQNYPNPFNPSTYIEYTVPFESRVRIVVYNSLGEVVKELFDSVVKPGYNKLLFDAGKLASGMYVYSLTANSIDGLHEYRSSKKMLLIK